MSIRENELRVGVHILYCEKVFQVDAECINMHWGDDLDDAYRPIPITEEWLLRFGIDFTSEKEWYHITFTIKGLLFETSTSMDGFTYNLCFEDMINIKYVHQFQNIYFALTGEELTITE